LHDAETEHDHDDFESFVVPLPEIGDPMTLAQRVAALGEAHGVLAALLPADFALLTPHFKDLHFTQGVMLQEAGEAIEHVYFPHAGMISLLTVMRTGTSVETATIGREGVVGASTGLGGRISASRAVEGNSSQT
jgi:CRP-like cAMP-binding protein